MDDKTSYINSLVEKINKLSSEKDALEKRLAIYDSQQITIFRELNVLSIKNCAQHQRIYLLSNNRMILKFTRENISERIKRITRDVNMFSTHMKKLSDKSDS